MSGLSIMKKTRKASTRLTVDSRELKSIISSMLLPITNSLNNLNERVLSLVNALESRNNMEISSPVHDLGTSSITADIIAEETQCLARSYSSLSDQVSNYQKNLQQINDKLASMDKLLGTLVRRQSKKGMETSDMVTMLDDYFSSTKSAKLGNNDESDCKLSESLKALETKPLQVLTLNKEDDFPGGSWLGDPDSAKARVRCPISPSDMLHINFRCSTPEKMALRLLDHLFSRETLSVSNISGKSKLGKKRLNPLMIYGIKCHLIYHFGITEKRWERIKANIDSKCRTAWRKRQSDEPGYCISVIPDVYAEDSQSKDSDDVDVPIFQEDDDGRPKKRVLRTLQGDIAVLSSEQILRFQDYHNIHVLDGDSILPIIQSDGEDGGIAQDRGPDRSHLAIISDENRHDAVSFVMEPMLADDHSLTTTAELLEDTLK